MVAINKAINKIAADKNGFSLLETVLTIIIIGLAMGAIVESFVTGSAKSVNIVNEETAVNVAKQTMAELNYCRNGGAAAGVCAAFNNNGGNCSGNGNGIDTWDCPSSFISNPTIAQPVNNQCFYTIIKASKVDFNDTNGSGTITINGSSNMYIQTIVQTGWFEPSGGSCPATPPASYPSVTVSTIFANY